MKRVVASGPVVDKLRADLASKLAGRYTVGSISVERVERKFPVGHPMYAAGQRDLDAYWGVFFTFIPVMPGSILRRLRNLGQTTVTAEPAVAVAASLGVQIQDVGSWSDHLRDDEVGYEETSRQVVRVMVEREDLDQKWRQVFRRALVAGSLGEDLGPEDQIPDLHPEILAVSVHDLNAGKQLRVEVGMSVSGITSGQQAVRAALVEFLNGVGQADWYALTNMCSVWGLNQDGSFTQVGAKMTLGCYLAELGPDELKKFLKIGVRAGLGD